MGNLAGAQPAPGRLRDERAHDQHEQQPEDRAPNEPDAPGSQAVPHSSIARPRHREAILTVAIVLVQVAWVIALGYGAVWVWRQLTF